MGSRESNTGPANEEHYRGLDKDAFIFGTGRRGTFKTFKQYVQEMFVYRCDSVICILVYACACVTRRDFRDQTCDVEL